MFPDNVTIYAKIGNKKQKQVKTPRNNEISLKLQDNFHPLIIIKLDRLKQQHQVLQSLLKKKQPQQGKSLLLSLLTMKLLSFFFFERLCTLVKKIMPCYFIVWLSTLASSDVWSFIIDNYFLPDDVKTLANLRLTCKAIKTEPQLKKTFACLEVHRLLSTYRGLSFKNIGKRYRTCYNISFFDRTGIMLKPTLKSSQLFRIDGEGYVHRKDEATTPDK